MNKRKAVVVLVATLVVAIAISGWYIHIIAIDEVTTYTTTRLQYETIATTDTYTKALFFFSPSSTPYIRDAVFENYNETNLREHYGESCVSLIKSNEDFYKYSPHIMYHNSFIQIAYTRGEPTKDEILQILGDNLTIKFSSYEGIPPVEKKVGDVKFVEGCFGGEYDVAIFDIGDYSVRFEDATPRYVYSILVVSNTKISTVEAYFFDFETTPFSVDWFEPPMSNWGYCSSDEDLGDIYYVQVAPEKGAYPPKTIAPDFVTTTSSYEEVEGELVELITQKYEVEVFFEPLKAEGEG